jgi:hypothetical protein
MRLEAVVSLRGSPSNPARIGRRIGMGLAFSLTLSGVPYGVPGTRMVCPEPDSCSAALLDPSIPLDPLVLLGSRQALDQENGPGDPVAALVIESRGRQPRVNYDSLRAETDSVSHELIMELSGDAEPPMFLMDGNVAQEDVKAVESRQENTGLFATPLSYTAELVTLLQEKPQAPGYIFLFFAETASDKEASSLR